MASTGATVHDETITAFNEFKKSSNPNRFMIMKIDDKGKILVESINASSNFSDFLALLPEKDGRYAVYKMDFTTNDGRPGEKLVSISWVPDASPVRTRMVYSGSKDAISRVLVGISVKINATDMSELTESIVQDACRKFA